MSFEKMILNINELKKEIKKEYEKILANTYCQIKNEPIKFAKVKYE